MTQKRGATLVLAALLLGGCDSNRDTTYSQAWQVVKASVQADFGNQRITRAQAAGVPYASMGWRLDGGLQSLIVLATDTNGDQMWTSAERVVLVTHDGRLLRSVGLPHNLGGRSSKSGEPAPSPAQALKGAFQSRWVVDYPDTGHYGVQIDCQSRYAGRETIKILGEAMMTARIAERCYSPDLRWRFTNTFWVDPQNGTVWRARQYYHPQAGVLETELFRPPG